MKNKIYILGLFLTIFCCVEAKSIGNLEFSIDSLGYISAHLKITKALEQEKKDSFQYGMIPVILPFEIKENSSIIPSLNEKVILLSKTEKSSLVLIFYLRRNNFINVRFQNFTRVQPSLNNKNRLIFKLEFDFHDIGLFEKELLNFPNAVQQFDYSIILPKVFSRSEVSAENFIRVSNRKYKIPIANQEDYFFEIAFPLEQRETNWDMSPRLLGVIIAGIILVLIALVTDRNNILFNNWRDGIWQIAIAIIIPILATIAYLNNLPFSEAFALGVGFCLVVYANILKLGIFEPLIAKKLGATVEGLINIFDESGNLINDKSNSTKIVLYRNGEIFKETKTHKGKFKFYFWYLKKDEETLLKIHAGDIIVEMKQEVTFKIKRGVSEDRGVIVLELRDGNKPRQAHAPFIINS